MAASIAFSKGEIPAIVPTVQTPGSLESPPTPAKSVFDPKAIQKSVTDIEKRVRRRRSHTSKVEKPKANRQSKRQSEGRLITSRQIWNTQWSVAKSNPNVKLAADTKPFILTPAKLKLIIETVAHEYVQLRGLNSGELDRVIGVCQDLANTQFEGRISSAYEASRARLNMF